MADKDEERTSAPDADDETEAGGRRSSDPTDEKRRDSEDAVDEDSVDEDSVDDEDSEDDDRRDSDDEDVDRARRDSEDALEEDSVDDEDDDRRDSDDDEGGEASAAARRARRRRRRGSDEEEADEGDARSAEVAKALGVGDEDEDEEAEEKEGPTNRAERRRQRALQRRRRRKQTEAEEEGEEPRDRNRRRRQRLLERRRAAAEAEEADAEEAVPAQLTTSEMMDDALARGSAAFIRWLQRHRNIVASVLVVGLLGGAGFLYWTHRQDTERLAASKKLHAALEAEVGVVLPPEKQQEQDDDSWYPVEVFDTKEAKRKAALNAYTSVVDQHAGTGAAYLAKLGRAGLLLEKQDYDEALSSYEAVLGSELAKADPDVRARALEGKGFALEGKDDLDGALAVYVELSQVEGAMYEHLGQYHQARIHHYKQEDDKAKKLLKSVKKGIEDTKLDVLDVEGSDRTAVHPFRWLERARRQLLKEIDPDAVEPSKPGGGQIPPGKLQELLREKGLKGGIPTP